MFEVEYCKVVGMKETLNVMLLSGADLPGDSYETHIEDTDTLETAPYQFVLGEKDLAAIKADPNLMNAFRQGIMCYCHIVSDFYFGYSMECCSPISYQRLYMMASGAYSDINAMPYHIQNEFRSWVASLPYADELGLLEDEGECEACKVNLE